MEEELRTIMAEAGLSWVLSRLDESTSHGVVEERPLDGHEHLQSLKFPMGTEEMEGSSRTVGSVRPRVGMTNRPQTVRERVLSLLSAIKRVTIELPTIEQDTLVRLVDPAAEKQVAVLSVQFLPDEDMMDAETVLKRGGDADERRRLAFGRILAALQGEARS